MTDKPHVLVVGAGIIGASIAWHLARSGARVTIVEAGKAGGVATRNSWAWINASHGNPEPYFRLRVRSMAEWGRLEREVPGIRVGWCGGLLWDLPPDALAAFAAEHGAWGYGIRRVDGVEAARIEPALAAPPALALHVAAEGAVEPLAAAKALISAAVLLGATLREGCAARALDRAAGRIVDIETDRGRIAADEVVLAAGAATAALAATAGIDLPMSAPPGLLVHTTPHARLLNGLVMAPGVHVRQTAEGRLVAGSDFAGTDPGDDADAVAAELFAAVKAMLRGGDALTFDFHTVGYRPVPADGFPAVGRFDGFAGLYVAALHSGITLAPAIGRFAAEEILAGRRDTLLAPYGPGRFATAPPAAAGTA
jgi:glycine/D-amino acid oxidase-like deaminating enzyme